MSRIRNPEKKHVLKSLNLMMTLKCKAPVFLSRRIWLKAKETAFVRLRLKNYNELIDKKHRYVIKNTKVLSLRKIILNHQEWPLRQCLVEYS